MSFFLETVLLILEILKEIFPVSVLTSLCVWRLSFGQEPEESKLCGNSVNYDLPACSFNLWRLEMWAWKRSRYNTNTRYKIQYNLSLRGAFWNPYVKFSIEQEAAVKAKSLHVHSIMNYESSLCCFKKSGFTWKSCAVLYMYSCTIDSDENDDEDGVKFRKEWRKCGTVREERHGPCVVSPVATSTCSHPHHH